MTSTAAADSTRPESGGPDPQDGAVARSATPPPASAYRERLLPAAWIWLAAALLAALISLIAVPFGATAAGVTSVAVMVVLGLVLITWSPVIELRDGELVAGRAHIPVALLGEIVPLDAVAMRHELGRGLDARAYLCMRGWITQGVRISLVDPDDPTPYWLISSRHPEALAAALGRVRAEGGTSR